MCISLPSLSLSLPAFAFLNGSSLLKLLMNVIAFLFDDIADTASLPSTVNQFDSSKVVYVVDHLSQLVGLFG